MTFTDLNRNAVKANKNTWSLKITFSEMRMNEKIAAELEKIEYLRGDDVLLLANKSDIATNFADASQVKNISWNDDMDRIEIRMPS